MTTILVTSNGSEYVLIEDFKDNCYRVLCPNKVDTIIIYDINAIIKTNKEKI